MSGTEQLKQNGYLKPGATTLEPDPYGTFGSLNIGQVAFGTLGRYLDLDLHAADSFEPTRWKKPANIATAKPDQLIVSGKSVVAVVEHKTTLPSVGVPQADLEQLQCYGLVTKARLGVLTDGTTTYWVHNLDPKRRNEVKTIAEDGRFFQEAHDPAAVTRLLGQVDPATDEVKPPDAFDASTVARSIWQDVYIATRQDPECCFQTFVELFMYNLISDYALLPSAMRISSLAVKEDAFVTQQGKTQIEYYFETVRPYIKANLFPERTTEAQMPGLTSASGTYRTTKEMVGSLVSAGGETSILNGHAFGTQPADYNGAFVRILKKLNDLPQITSLDAGFKSRIYEQFLRREMNTSKVSGKYFTPRNVVKAIIRMADVASLHQEAVVCDPSCGVGGFITESLLELERVGKKNYEEAKGGKIQVKRKFVGLEVLQGVVCLAKANLLLHNIETYHALSPAGRSNFNQLLADVVVHAHEDQSLGTLKHPVSEAFDLIMANPPYIVSGTKTQTDKIKSEGLSDYYSAGGTGLESRFVNWIVNALRPGGRGFIVLPKSMLARVEKRVKEYVMKHCFVDALVCLPERSFFTTPSVTYVLAVTKKEDPKAVQTTPVFCYYVRDIGETRDIERRPTRNDLVAMVQEFRAFKVDPANYAPSSDFAKVLPVSDLDPSLRWDIEYLWTPQDLARLGVLDTNVRTYAAVAQELQAVKETLADAEQYVASRSVQPDKTRDLSLSDATYFEIVRGKRVTTKECEKHPGSIPVVASGRHEDSYLGTISEDYLNEQGHVIYTPADNMMSVGATGAVGSVHLRREEKWFLHDDALAIRVVHPDLLPEYVRLALQQAIHVARFDYTAKLYQERLSALEVPVPVKDDGSFDLDLQRQMAEAYERQEEMERELHDVAERLRAVLLER